MRIGSLRRIGIYTGLFVLVACLFACSQSNFAPVSEAWAPTRSDKVHIVQKGDTLYAIAWAYGFDYRNLAKINRLQAPYRLRTGQVVQLKPRIYSQKPQKRALSANKSKLSVSKQGRRSPPKRVAKISNKPVKRWVWPAKGKIIKRFSPKKGNKGINIAGRQQQIVKAAAAGRIAYSGSGLRAYGKLLIIKHNDVFLSAYAHNQKLLVKEGQWVKAGQQIAEMGNMSSRNAMLHFEIRKAGKPVNPLRYLR